MNVSGPVAIHTPLPGIAAASRAPDRLVAPFAGVAELTAGLAAGNEDAFREFHARYFDRLLRYLVVLCRGDEQAAREALQDTFLRVARHARPLHDEAAFWSWLAVLTRSAAVDQSRRTRRYWRLLSRYALEWLRPAPQPNAGPGHESSLDHALDAALNRLEALDRALIEAKYFRGAPVRELAAEHGLTEKAVESRLGRARQRLREHLLESLRHENAA